MCELRNDFNLEEYYLKNFVNTSPKEKETIRNCRNHQKIARWMYSDKIISSEEHVTFINKLKEDNKNYYWMVLKEEEFIGVVSLNKIDYRNRNAYIGIYSNPTCKLNNKGNSLIYCLKKLAFDIAKFHTLKLEVIENNEDAINFYKKSKFQEEGKLKEFVFKDGKWYSVILMGIINHEEQI